MQLSKLQRHCSISIHIILVASRQCYPVYAREYTIKTFRQALHIKYPQTYNLSMRTHDKSQKHFECIKVFQPSI